MDDKLVVPFGKYKGQPVEVLHADRAYTDWLVEQGWLQQRFPELHTLIINHFGEPSETPAHNQLQLRFLDATFCAQVSGLLLEIFPSAHETPFYTPPSPVFEAGGIDVSWTLAEWDCTPEQHTQVAPTVLYDAYVAALCATGRPFGCTRCAARPPALPVLYYDGDYGIMPSSYYGSSPESVALKAAREANEMYQRQKESRLMFPGPSKMDGLEQEQWRAAAWTLQEACRVHKAAFEAAKTATETAWAPLFPYLLNRVSCTTLHPHLRSTADLLAFAVECKPTLGDDYPAVLRQMQHWQTPPRCKKALVVGTCTAKGGTLTQIRLFFRRANILVLTVEDIEAATPLAMATFDDFTRMSWGGLDETITAQRQPLAPSTPPTAPAPLPPPAPDIVGSYAATRAWLAQSAYGPYLSDATEDSRP